MELKRPAVLDNLEAQALAESIVLVHSNVVAAKRFSSYEEGETVKEEQGKVLACIQASFCSLFGEPPSSRYEDIFDQVADFAVRLSKDHVFLDGNKRTTVKVSLALLRLYGVEIDIDDASNPEGNDMYLWIQSAVQQERSEVELAELALLLRSHASFRGSANGQ